MFNDLDWFIVKLTSSSHNHAISARNFSHGFCQWGFLIWNIFFRYIDIFVFALCKWGKCLRHRCYHWNSTTLNEQYLKKYQLKQCSSNLAREIYTSEERKWHPSCRCHENSYATGPVVIKTKFPRLYPKQGLSTHNNLMGIVKAIWEPFVCRARPSVPV